MAYAIVDGSIIELAYGGVIDGQRTLSLFHYRTSGGTITDGAAYLNDFIGDAASSFGLLPAYLDCCSEQFAITIQSAQMIWAPGPSITRRPRVTVTGSTAGTVTEVAQPSSVAVAITKRTDIAGRAGLGTLHMPGVPATFIEYSKLTAAALSVYQGIANSLTEDYVNGPNTLQPVLFRRAAPADSPLITTSNVEDTSRTMRRRVVGRGI